MGANALKSISLERYPALSEASLSQIAAQSLEGDQVLTIK
jgi:hypothetical protein